MTVRVEIERLVVHDIPLAQVDRRRLLAAVEQAIAEQTAGAAAGWDIADAAVPVVHTAPIILASDRAAGTQLDALAGGIATAATTAMAQTRGGTR
jgi:hypothetical protein